MSEELTKKAAKYIKRMDSEQLKEVMDFAFELIKEANPHQRVYYCWLDEKRIFWAMWDNPKNFFSGENAKHHGIVYYERGKKTKLHGRVYYLGAEDLYKILTKDVIKETGEPFVGDIYYSYHSPPLLERNDLKRYYRKLVAEKKAAKPKPQTKDARAVKFVYGKEEIEEMNDFDLNNIFSNIFQKRKIVPYRVIKETKKKIFISKKSVKHETNDGFLKEHFALDREVFERDGVVYHKSARKRFYKDKKAAGISGNEHLLEMFDIEGELTKENLKTAYRRKAKELHPDHGGDSQAFVDLEEAYKTLRNFIT